MSEQQTMAMVPDSHPALAGHFPDRPIVPGVVIVEQVLLALNTARRLRAIPNLKFLHPLQPNQAFRIRWSEHGDEVRFRCERDEQLLAQGVLWLQDDAG